ncbi:MAG: lmo0937 family membrane protein [Nitrospirae bacterium]|nr:lmo0937 family membrane protein [Nitrospirota bacterium]
MLEKIVVILVIFWLLGLVSSYTMGGLIHILLIAAVVVLVVRLMRRR